VVIEKGDANAVGFGEAAIIAIAVAGSEAWEAGF